MDSVAKGLIILLIAFLIFVFQLNDAKDNDMFAFFFRDEEKSSM